MYKNDQVIIEKKKPSIFPSQYPEYKGFEKSFTDALIENLEKALYIE